MNKIIEFSVNRRWLVIIIVCALVVSGLWSFQHLSIDAVPDITNNQVQVNTTVPGLAPEEIERLITFPVESSMRGIAGVVQVRSITRFGLSQVTVVFKDDVGIYLARQLVSERLQNVLKELPKGSEARMGPVTTGLGEIYQYVVDFKTQEADPVKRFQQLIELKALQDWSIKQRLLTVEGVAEVNTSGGFEKQFHIQPKLDRMRTLGMRFEDILEALKRANQNVGGGVVQQTSEQFLVQGAGLFRSIEDIEAVPIKTLENFNVIRIRDVATVQIGRQIRTGAATLNGQEAILGTVLMLIGENSRTVALRVDEKMEEIRKSLPEGVSIRTVYSRSDLVNATLGTVEHNLIMGATLVIIILFLLIGNIRAAIITAVTIPCTLLITFLIMKPLGISGNLMSLGALDFGLIVDGAVIMIDNCIRFIHHRTEEAGRKLTKDEIKQAVIDACIEVRSAAGFGELIVMIVFIPIFALSGVEGKMFRPMATTFCIAILSALILSFTLIPAIASLVLNSKVTDSEPRFMKWLYSIYNPILNFATQRRQVIFIGAICSVVIGVILFATRGSEFLPQLQEGSFAFHMIRPVNTSIDQSAQMQLQAEKIVMTFPEVSHTFSRIGTSEIATDPMGVNVSDTFIMLKSRDEWSETNNGEKHTYLSLTQAIVDKLEKEVPGQTYLASQPIQMRFNELLEGTRADVSVKVFGPDLYKNMELAKSIQAVVQKVQGAGDVEVDLAGLSPVLSVNPKKDALYKYGLSTLDVLETVSIALGGEEVGTFYEQEKRFPIIVRLDDETRSDLSIIKTLPVGTGTNQTTPLGSLAETKFSETFGSINRENSHRRSAVLINLRGRDTESFVNEAQKAVAAAVRVPQDYYVEWGGNFKNLQEAKTRLMILAPIALLIVLFMIYSAFGSFVETFMILSCVPFALVGGVIGLILNGLPFSISAGVGFIALSGISVLNGIVLVNYFNQLKAEGMSGFELVRKGALIRLRPVLMTALVAIFGFIPMMLSKGIGAEVQKPLASVVIGGIVSCTILTLVVLPVIYLLVEKKISGVSQEEK